MDISETQNIRQIITWIGVYKMYEDWEITLCKTCMNNTVNKEGEVCKECDEYYTKSEERLKNEKK